MQASAPRNTVTIPFEPVALGRLVVRVRDEAGDPVPGAYVTMKRESTGSAATRTIGQSGDYAIALHPDRFQLIIGARGYVHAERVRDMAEGEEVVVEVTLEAEPDLDAMLARLFAETEPLRIYTPLSLGDYLGFLDALQPGTVGAGDELTDSGFLDILQVKTTARAVAAVHLASVIRRLDLRWRVERNQLLLERPAGK